MAKGRSRAGGRARKPARADAPTDIYQRMLDEADQAAASAHDVEGKTVKKRRVGGRIVVQPDTPAGLKELEKEEDNGKVAVDNSDGMPISRHSTQSPSPEPMLQVIDYDPEESDEDEDEIFEDVDIDVGDDLDASGADEGQRMSGETLNLVLRDDEDSGKKKSRRRKAATAISDKKLAIRTHKLHLLCLLSHLSLRNHWCNDSRAQKSLRKLVSKKIREQLADDEGESQYTRDLKLREGLQQAAEMFRDRFQKTAKGLTRAWWDSPESSNDAPSFDDLDLFTSVEDFRRAAANTEGSRDVAAQLFCTMLRACGLEVRLVHSLQPLPVNGAIRPEQQIDMQPRQVVRYQDSRSSLNTQSSSVDRYSHTLTPEEDISTEEGRAMGVRRKLAKLGGRSSLSKPSSLASRQPPARPVPARPGPKRFQESLYPTYWVEVFSPAYQKWIPIDPLVTRSFSKPSALCPAQKDSLNVLAYVIGIEDDGSARDITRRYSSIYNAKTRKLRIDAIAGSEGSKWWRKVLRLYRRPTGVIGVNDARDSIEDAEFKRREAREGMPKNVEDFKGHPLYVLERQLRRNEVLHPKRQVGTAGGEKGTATKGKPVEPVFRREDVHVVKSADAWYRLGRETKLGEQPLKRVPSRRRRDRRSSAVSDGDESEAEDQGLYAFFQTVLYQAPPVMLGKVPRNAYGNLDVYVPSMIPPGAVHVLHEDTKHAAKLVKIDFADAVTGFEFKGRQGTAVVRGAIIAAEYKEAVLEVLHGFEAEKAAAADAELTKECLRLWRKFLVGLRVKERVSAYAKDDQSDVSTDGNAMEEFDDGMYEQSDDEGGFVPEAQSRAKRPTRSRIPMIGSTKGDFTVVDGPRIEDIQDDDANPMIADQSAKNSAEGEPEGNLGGGGFLVEEPDDSSLFGTDSADHEAQGSRGGFITEDEETQRMQSPVDSSPIESRSKPSEHSQAVTPIIEEMQRQISLPSRKEPRLNKDTQSGPATITEPSLDPHSKADEDENDAATSVHEDDRGSLLSEDPEDFDADPEWLA